MTTLSASPTTRAAHHNPRMRAAVIAAPGVVRLDELPIPQPGPGQVRIKLEGCGVCGSNIPSWEGRPWFNYPLEPGKPGHEGYGTIDAVGPNVQGLRPGQRVGALTYNAFAEYDLAQAGNVVPLPRRLDGVPVPIEALGCAVNVFRRSAIQPGNTVAIVGYGFLGALVGQLAAAHGARVIAITRRPCALKTARALGIEHTLDASDHAAALAQVQSLTSQSLCDVVIEAAGAQQSLDLATQLTRERGRLVIAGFHQDGPRTVDMFQWNWRGLDAINAHERDPRTYIQGMRGAIDAIAAGHLNPAPLYTHTFPLEQLADALNAAKDRPHGFMKAIVLMQP